MSNVEFSEEEAYQTSLEQRAQRKERGLMRLVIRLGLAKDETGASLVLGGVAVLAALLAVVIFGFALTS